MFRSFPRKRESSFDLGPRFRGDERRKDIRSFPRKRESSFDLGPRFRGDERNWGICARLLLFLLAFLAVAASPAPAQTNVPQFRVEPFWPKPLPHNWILGQVSGIAVDRHDRIWVVHRPTTLTPRERAAEQ